MTESQSKPFMVDLMRVVCDFVIAWSFVKKGSINGKYVGLLGSFTSLISIYQMWKWSTNINSILAKILFFIHLLYKKIFFLFSSYFHPSGGCPCGMIFLNTHIQSKSSIEESKDLPSNMPVPRLIMGKHTLVGRNHQMPKLSWRQNAVCPLLKVSQGQIVARRNHSTFVDAANELNHNFLGTMVINNFELSDVAMDLHEFEELDEEFGDRPDEYLLFAFALCIDDGLEAVRQDVHFDHCSNN